MVTVFGNVSFAAAFDCTKARTKPERMICADKALSNLDEQLSRLYNSIVSHSVKPEGVKGQQREWIKKIRDKCNSESCLRDAYQKRIIELNDQAIELSRKGSVCPVTERSLIAGWKLISGEGFFEEMAFEHEEGKRVFNSWLHQRPEIINGSWRFEDCTIFINHSTSRELSFIFKITGFRKDRIHLHDVTENLDSTYKRVKE